MTNDELRQLAGTPDRAREIAERYAKHCVAYARDPSVLDSETRVDATAEAMAQALYEYAAPIERERDEAVAEAKELLAAWKRENGEAVRLIYERDDIRAKLARVEAVLASVRFDEDPRVSEWHKGRRHMHWLVTDALIGDERKDG